MCFFTSVLHSRATGAANLLCEKDNHHITTSPPHRTLPCPLPTNTFARFAFGWEVKGGKLHHVENWTLEGKNWILYCTDDEVMHKTHKHTAGHALTQTRDRTVVMLLISLAGKLKQNTSLDTHITRARASNNGASGGGWQGRAGCAH